MEAVSSFADGFQVPVLRPGCLLGTGRPPLPPGGDEEEDPGQSQSDGPASPGGVSEFRHANCTLKGPALGEHKAAIAEHGLLEGRIVGGDEQHVDFVVVAVPVGLEGRGLMEGDGDEDSEECFEALSTFQQNSLMDVSGCHIVNIANEAEWNINDLAAFIKKTTDSREINSADSK